MLQESTLAKRSDRNRIDQVFDLPNGRRIGFAEWGSLDGFPVFLLHGTPGSRRWFTQDDPVAHQLGLRLITPDRPGYGLSTPLARRCVLDYPEDIKLLADYLGINHFSVIGVSGGSAYAAACASLLAPRVVSAGLVAGVAEFDRGRIPTGMCRENRFAFLLSRYFPCLLRQGLLMGRKLMEVAPQRYIEGVEKNISHLCASDQKVMRGEGAQVLMHLREAFRQNVREAAAEPALLMRPWGFRLADIAVPVHLWHGTDDTLAPIGPVQKMAEQIPHCKRHFLEGKGHFLSAEEGLWAEILSSVKPQTG
jgi:pimeloyl-ACP methyl ester carboxylesterase